MRLEVRDRLSATCHKLPRQVRERVAFMADPLLEGPLRDTNFRLTRSMLGELEDLLSPEVVVPLRRVIVDTRVRAYRGLLTGMGAQAWFLASLASGSSSLLETVLQMGAIGIGAGVEKYDRGKAYLAVRQTAIPVTTELINRYGDDLRHRFDKETLAIDLAEAFAMGEKLPHPQLTHFAHFLITMATLLSARQPELNMIAGGRSGYEFFLQRYLGTALNKGVSLTANINALDEATGLLKQTQVTLGRDVSSILSVKDFLTKTWEIFNELSWRHGLVEFGLKTGVPIAVLLKNVPLVNYLAALAGFSGSYLEPLFGNWEDYAQARAGIEELQTVLTTIRENQTSLLTGARLNAHCQESMVLTSVEKPIQPEAVAVIAPFTLSLPGRKNLLGMKKPLVLMPGFTDVSAEKRSGVTSFLKALAHWIETEDLGESLIKVDGKWVGFHSRGELLRGDLIFLPSEPQLIQYEGISELLKVSPSALFAHLFRLSERHLAGEEAEFEFRQLLARYQLEIESKTRRLFSDDEIKTICEAKSLADLRSPFRAKLRLIYALEQRPRILLIDGLLDSLKIEEDALEWILFIGEWCKRENTAVVIATDNHLIRSLLRQPPYYRQTIFFEKSQVQTTLDGAGRTMSLLTDVK